jgi:hypothetical protein
MTSSFNTVLGKQRDAAPDISQYNYADTATDLTASVEKGMKDTQAQLDSYWKTATLRANQYHKNRQERDKALLNLTTTGIKFAKEKALRDEAEILAGGYYDQKNPDQIISRKTAEAVAREEAEFKEDNDALEERRGPSQTASREADKAGFPFIGGILRRLGLIADKEAAELTEVAANFPVAFERIANSFEHQLPDGTWITMDKVNPGDTETYRLVHKGISEVVISEILRDNPEVSKRLIKKYVVQPAYQKYLTDQTKFVEAGVKAEKEFATENRKNHAIKFITALPVFTVDPGITDDPILMKPHNEATGDAITQYLDTYYGFHDFNRKKGKQEFFDFIHESYGKGEKGLDAKHIEAIGNALIKPLDGGKRRTVKEYWSKEFSELDKKVTDKQTEKLNLDKQKEDNIKLAKIQGYKKEYNELIKTDYTREQLKEWFIAKEKEFNTAHPAGDTWFTKSLTKLETQDTDSEFQRITYDHDILGQSPDEADLLLFEPGSPEWNTVKKWIDAKGLTSKDLTTWKTNIDGYISDETGIAIGDPSKSSPLFNTMTTNAMEDFPSLYWEELDKRTKDIGLPVTDFDRKQAMKLAASRVKENIKKGDYQQFIIYPPDQKRIRELKNVSEALSNNPGLIDSKEYWEGEEPHLLSALNYITKRKGTIPQFYIDVASKLRTTKEHKGITRDELMRSRLKNVGLVNEEFETIPERLLDLEKQIKLLNKPSPAKSLRAFYDLEGTELEGLLEVSKFEDLAQLTNAFREGAATSNSYTTTGLDWIQQVNIDPQLMEQYNSILDVKIPYYSSPDTLLPGVAEKLVKDTLIEPERNQPKIPGSSIYNEKTGTGWKRSELGDWEFYRNFELAEDDSPFSREWIWDTYRKAWTPSTNVCPLKEPASKAGKYLEQVPGLLSNAFADIPKKLIQEPLESIGSRTTGSVVFEGGRELTVHQLEQKNENSKE